MSASVSALDPTDAGAVRRIPRGCDDEEVALRIECALRRAFDQAVGEDGPPRLRQALLHGVFGGGARLRPALCLAVAAAYRDPDPIGADGAAAAVEFVHCASLVHDDLPCFDDAQLRRGKPTTHVAFGVPLAVLAGDALIVAAFGTLARTGHAALTTTLAEATGAARGIVAGQAWEGEPAPPLDEYHRAKTAALFVAAACMGAQVTQPGRTCASGKSGAELDLRPWIAFGDAVGRAYQAADDVLDAIADSSVTGKTGGRDASLGRPSVVQAHGLSASRRRVARLVEEASCAVPSCPNEAPVRAWLERFAAKSAR